MTEANGVRLALRASRSQRSWLVTNVNCTSLWKHTPRKLGVSTAPWTLLVHPRTERTGSHTCTIPVWNTGVLFPV